jgi:hypothetical protein
MSRRFKGRDGSIMSKFDGLSRGVVISLVTGLSFAVGVLLAYEVYREVREAQAPIVVERPEGLEFPDHARVPGQLRFTVRGTLANTSGTWWESVRVVASIFAGEAYMTSCWRDLPKLPPHSRQPFEVVCKSTEGAHVPANVTYRLSVPSAVRRRGD